MITNTEPAYASPDFIIHPHAVEFYRKKHNTLIKI